MKLYFYIWLDTYQLRLSLKFPLLGGNAAPTALREVAVSSLTALVCV